MIIGLTGHLESGKSTLANSIKEHHTEGGVLIMAFARPLKDMCRDYFGFSYEDLYTSEGKTKLNSFWNITPREFMQRLGQGLRDAICPDVWVKLMEQRILEKKNTYRTIICDDIRHPNEAELIHKLGGVTVRIHRPEHEAKYVGIKNHPSEQELAPEIIDYEVFNTGDPEQMYQALKTLIPTL